MKCLIATDDLKPRKIAEGLGLDIIETLGILRLAYKENLLNKNELRQDLQRILDLDIVVF